MQFDFSLHSLEQIELRSISKEIVEFVINNPDDILLDSDNQQIFQKIVDNYLYRVFVNNDKNPSLIKTVYRTSKITKYL
ncbi:DUF4258 domain-containing protein [Flavobacterium sp.]|uniref:DUF4258 domain-containing protein n=1 Tax=Flavobacterium sp. TaxID=239 RepID=UPI003751D081